MLSVSALCELVSFHTAKHIRDEIRHIDGSVHHHHHLQTVCIYFKIRLSRCLARGVD